MAGAPVTEAINKDPTVGESAAFDDKRSFALTLFHLTLFYPRVNRGFRRPSPRPIRHPRSFIYV